LAVRKLKNNS
jgi:ATP-dependent Lon protease